MFEYWLAPERKNDRPLALRLLPLAISVLFHGFLFYGLFHVKLTVKIFNFGTEVRNIMIVPPPKSAKPRIVGPAGRGTASAAAQEKGLEGAGGRAEAGREKAGEDRGAGLTPPALAGGERAKPAGQYPIPALSAKFKQSVTSRFKPGQEPSLKITLGPPGSQPAPQAAAGKARSVNFYDYIPGPFSGAAGKGYGKGPGRGGGGPGGQRAVMTIPLKGYNLAPWAQKVLELIQRNWILPAVGKLQAQTSVKLTIMIKKNGDLSSMEILQTASYEVLDQAVLKALRASLPFPALPDDFPGEILEAYFEFIYDD